jgi:hypothetical protein
MTKTKRIANSILVEELAKKILARRPTVEKNLKKLTDVELGVENVDSGVDSDESEEDSINDVQVEKSVQVEKAIQVQKVAKNSHGKGKKKNNNPKKNKGGRKSYEHVECKQMECDSCMRYHDDPEAQRSMQTFKLIKPRENVNLFIRNCGGS